MSFWDKDGEGSDNEEDEGEEVLGNSNDLIIFLIDGRAPMFEPNARGETHIQNCLSIALAVMKSKIIANGENASVGLAFFGTKDSPDGQVAGGDGNGDATSCNGVLTLLNLAPPSAIRIRQLQRLVDSPAELRKLVTPHPTACPLKQALWTCSQSFGAAAVRKKDMKRIWIFSNDDNPNQRSSVEQAATITVAQDCAQAGIDISLWHLDASADKPFDPELFYMKLLRGTAQASQTASQSVPAAAAGGPSNSASLQAAGEEDAADFAVENRIIGAGYEGFDPDMAGVRRREFRKRRLGSTLLSLTSIQPQSGSTVGTGAGAGAGAGAGGNSGFSHVGIMLYNSIQVAKKPQHVWLYHRTNEPVKLVSTYYDAATGETLPPERVATCLEVGGATSAATDGSHACPLVAFNAEEMKYIKQCGNAVGTGVGLQILFYMPQTSLSNTINLESSYFLFPDEKTVRGSSVLFEALLRDLAAKVPLLYYTI
jgi:ATP-dependent DNA helicase 2 subunit 1